MSSTECVSLSSHRTHRCLYRAEVSISAIDGSCSFNGLTLPISTKLSKESIAESFQNPQAMTVRITGTIVLSSSCRLLFIDRNAIALLSVFESDSIPQGGARVIPACLMDLGQEIVTTSHSIRANPYTMETRVWHIFGPLEQQVRVQGFAISNPAGQDMRIVLVLSQWNRAITQER